MNPEERALRVNVSKFVLAKAAEEQAKATRIAAEGAIAAVVEGPEKGQATRNLSDGTKIVVKRSIIYHCNVAAISKTCKDFCEANNAKVHVPLKSSTKTVLDTEAYEYYRKNYPEFFSLLAKHVQVKPAKTSVTVPVCRSGGENTSDLRSKIESYHG